MAQITVDSEELKSAILELVRDNNEEFYEFFAEISEDIAMEQAIEKGEQIQLVSREAIFNLLDSES